MSRKYKKSLALCLKASTLLVSLSSGYGRGAYATSCTGGGGIYSCGSGIDVTQYLHYDFIQVTTSPGFSINTSFTGGDAFVLLSTQRGITFLDSEVSTITGQQNGITATNAGNGDSLSITTTSSITGITGRGIWAENGTFSTDLTISAASVSGGDDGIYAKNSGDGHLWITASGPVTAINDMGIFAENSQRGTDLTISAGEVSGNTHGIVAINGGNSILSITTTGSVTAGTYGIGIWTDNRAGTDLTINAASVSGGDDGINANNSGNGQLSITASGPVEGATDKGILADNSVNGTDLIISAGKVTGGSHGIVATNNGSGNLSITTTDKASGGQFGIGIWANNFGTDLNITAAEVTGGDKGILATNNIGTSQLSITASGPVTSTGDGMLAFAISAENKGSGPLSITTSDAVSSMGSGAYALGIYAHSFSSSTDITISTADVRGGYAGIYANANGNGTLAITSTGVVKATRGKAIVATNSSNGRDLTISVVDVNGSSDGIAATHSGLGALSISTSGMVTGTSGYGIHADNSGGQPTTINVGTQSIIKGGTAAIKVDSSTSQSATINVFGQVTNNSGLTTDNAIISSDGPTTVNLFTGSATTGGITLSNLSDTVTLAGTLNGSITLGGDNDTFIQVGGSTLTGTADGGLGNDTLRFNNMGSEDGSLLNTKYLNFENLGIFDGNTTLTGTWDFTSGTATIYRGSLNVNGSMSTSLLMVDNGGWLVDNGTITSGNLDIPAGGVADINGTANIGGNSTVGGLLNVNADGRLTAETLRVNSGATMSILGTANVHGVTDIFGNLSLDGTLITSLLTVEHGGFLGGNGNIFGDVTINGTVSPGHSIGTLSVDGSLSFMPGSTYIAELAADGSSDLIRVNGPVSISGGTVSSSLPVALYGNGHSWHILTATDGISGSFSSVNTNFNSYTVKLDQQIQGNSLDLVIVRTPYASFGATENQASVGAALDDLLPPAHGAMANLLFNMDFAMDPGKLTATLKGLSPEMYTTFPAAGLKVAETFNHIVAMRQQVEEGSATDEEQLWDVWGQVLGQRLDRDTEAEISGYTLNTDGMVFGMDRAFGQTTRAGLILGYSSSDLSWSDPGNSGQIDGKYIGIYGSSHLANFYVNGTTGYTNLDNNANRTITTPLFTSVTAASFNSNVFAGNLQGGYDFTFGNIRVGPVATLDYQYLDQQDFSEKGQDLTVRIVNGNNESLTASLGMRITDVFDSGSWRFLPRAEVALVHQFLDDGASLTSSFVDYQVATFTTCGAKPDANEGQASIGLSAEYKKDLSLYLNLSVTQADHENSRLLAGGLTWSF